CNLRPTSRGHVRVRSIDPMAAPEIRLNYLSTPEDKAVAARSMRFTRRIMAAAPMAKYSPAEWRPGAAAESDDALVNAAGDLGPSLRAALPDVMPERRAGSTAAPKLAAASVLSIDPRANPLKSNAVVKATLQNEYIRSKSYKALYERLKGSAEGQTAEGQFVLYEILRKCATITDRDTRRPLVRTSDQKRDDFLA